MPENKVNPKYTEALNKLKGILSDDDMINIKKLIDAKDYSAIYEFLGEKNLLDEKAMDRYNKISKEGLVGKIGNMFTLQKDMNRSFKTTLPSLIQRTAINKKGAASKVNLPLDLPKGHPMSGAHTFRSDITSLNKIRNVGIASLTDKEAKDLDKKILDAHKKIIPILTKKEDTEYGYGSDNHREDYFRLLAEEIGLNKLSDTDSEDIAKKRAIANHLLKTVQGNDDGKSYIKSLNSILDKNDPIIKHFLEDDFEDMFSNKILKDRFSISAGKLGLPDFKLVHPRLFDDDKNIFLHYMGVSPSGEFSQKTLKDLSENPVLSKYIDSYKSQSGDQIYRFKLPGTFIDGKFKTWDEVKKEHPFVNLHGTYQKHENDMIRTGFTDEEFTQIEEHIYTEYINKNNLGDTEYADMSAKEFFSKLIQKEGPESGYFKLEGEGGKYDTVYYTDKNSTIAFNSIEELETHMEKNHPDLFTEGVENSVSTFDKNDFSENDIRKINDLYHVKKTEKGVPTEERDLTGYLLEGIYKSDDYNVEGDGAGYTGKSKKVAIEGKEFDPSDPTTYKWQYEKYELEGAQYRPDGELVEGTGTKGKVIWEDAGDDLIDEDAFSGFTYKEEKKSEGTKKEVEVDKKWHQEAGNVVSALKAGAGIIGLGKAMKDIPIEDAPELSASFKAYMQKSKELAESGLTAAEKASIKNDLSNTYQLGAKNVLRASAGSRGTFLANMGMLNANRVNGLVKVGEIDASIQRKNMQTYGQALQFQENYKKSEGDIGRQMAYNEATRKSNLYGAMGSSLIGSALSDLSHAQQMKSMTPYMNEWAKNVGLTTAYGNVSSDVDSDAEFNITG